MRYKSLVCLLLIFCEQSSLTNINAQEKYQLKAYTSDNGLSHNFIQSIARDQTGFLWIATWDGLSRFDGYEFRNYYHNPKDSTSFPFFVIDRVLVDRLNNVWLYTQGLPAVLYDRAKDSFFPFSSGPIRDFRPRDILNDHNNNVWLNIDSTIYNFNPGTKLFQSFRITGDSSFKSISDVYGFQFAFDNFGAIWTFILVNNAYLIFKGSIQPDSAILFSQTGRLSLDSYKSSTIHNAFGVFDIYVTESGKVWLFSKYGLFYLDRKLNRFFENNNPVNPGEFKGKPFFLWADDKSGINVIDTENESYFTIKSKNGNFIESLIIDNEGIIWSSDINNQRENIGLNRYIKIPDYFRHFFTGSNENDSASLVFPILKDINNDLWVGKRYLDYILRIKPDGTQEKINLYSSPGDKNRREALSMAQDSGGIWIGTYNGLLIYYDFLTKKTNVKYPSQQGNNASLLSIHNILKSNNNLIINGGKGIYKFNPETDSLTLHYRHDTEGTGFSFVSDGKNGFWLGTWGNRVIHLDSELNKTNEFKIGHQNNIVEHICVGDSNDIWVALMGGGLGHLYPESGKSEIYTTSDGLSNNVTYSILKDDKGNLWISTNLGLSKFNPHTKQFSNYGKKEGLSITEFNSDSFFKTQNGEMFFGGVGGMVGFYPDSIDNYEKNNAKAPLIFTDFKVSGISRYFKKAVYEMDTLVLEKGDNNFQITFACLDFKNSEKIRYRYRLAGKTDKWMETDYRNRKINYVNLSRHDYKLEVEATNENGEWVNKTSVLIIIPLRLMEYLWVRIFLISLLLSGFVLSGSIYLRQRTLKERQIKDQLKLESLRGQMNPHFIFNSLNSINYFISNEDKLSANHYIADFSRLIRSILNNLSYNYIAFDKEIESLIAYLKLEHLRFGDKFNYSINTDNIPVDCEIYVFPGMIQPFIENAIWHGVRGLESRTGFIKIDFTLVSFAKIQCIVEDDGVGRRLADFYKPELLPGHKSRGIDIVRERLRIFNNMTKNNYQITIEDLYEGREETGTRVIIELPATDCHSEKEILG
jgi:streptogramin lyase